MPLLEAEDVSVRFGGVEALRAVSLHVHEGEIVALIGPNGAGKTTLFNAVSGVHPPDAGRVAFAGCDFTRTPTHERAVAGLGRTFQAVQTFAGMTVEENLMVGGLSRRPTGLLADLTGSRASRFACEAAREKARAFLSFLGLDDLAASIAGDLPFGIQRMVELGRALCAEPRMLLLDEPASGLDAHETEGLVRALRRVRDLLGVTLLLVEHDVGMVMRISDYVYVLEFGALIAHGTPRVVRENPAVVAAYLGEEHRSVDERDAGESHHSRRVSRAGV